jgi:tetratricopeptide (TPR) repeat protein
MSIRNLLEIILLFIVSLTSAWAQSYDEQLNRVRTAISEKHYPEAASAAEQAIKLDDKRWEAYVLAANAYSSQQFFDDAIGMLQMALPRAPEDRKQLVREALQQVRQQLVSSAPSSNPAAAPTGPRGTSAGVPAAVSQQEIVLWKSIENSNRAEDFRSYLAGYPNGTYATLARSHLDEVAKNEAEAARIETKRQADAVQQAEAKRFMPEVTHYHRGILMHQCNGPMSITAEGISFHAVAAEYGRPDDISFSREDVMAIEVLKDLPGGGGGGDVKFKLKNGSTWEFLGAPFADLITAKWGWVMSTDHKFLLPSR